MNGRYMGVTWMNDQRHAAGIEVTTFKFGPVRRCTLRQLFTVYMREAHAGLFKRFALFHHSRTTATTLLPLPLILLEVSTTINGFQLLANTILQAEQVIQYRLQHSLFHHDKNLTSIRCY